MQNKLKCKNVFHFHHFRSNCVPPAVTLTCTQQRKLTLCGVSSSASWEMVCVFALRVTIWVVMKVTLRYGSTVLRALSKIKEESRFFGTVANCAATEGYFHNSGFVFLFLYFFGWRQGCVTNKGVVGYSWNWCSELWKSGRGGPYRLAVRLDRVSFPVIMWWWGGATSRTGCRFNDLRDPAMLTASVT